MEDEIHGAINVTSIVEKIRTAFLFEHSLDNFQEINCGWCDLFAQEVLFELKGLGFNEMDSHEILMLENEEEDAGIIDEKAVKERYSIEIPPTLINVQIGYHVWLTDDKKHYDAECPEGVSNMFDLPFFQRYQGRCD
ncbi:hypothetical protein SMD22_01035 (plasmid) [Brevibacillus halotolerans]|nr:hypothetical protein SMD22_01035 [Brevibacillus halotolerans]